MAETTEESTTQKTSWIAEVSRNANPQNQITNLSLVHQRIPISLRRKDSKLRPFIEVRGTLSDSNAKLFLEDGENLYPIPVKDGNFNVYLYLNSVLSELKLQVQDLQATRKSEVFVVSAPDIQEYRIGKPWGTLQLGLGVGNLRYFQTRLGDYASINGMISANYETNDFFNRFYANLDVTASLWTVRSEPTNAAPQLIKINGNLHYRTLEPKKKMQVNPFIGIEYLTLLSNASGFGFANLLAPEFGLRGNYDFGQARVSLNALYVPLGGLLSKKEYGGEVGLTVGAKIRTSHYLDFGVAFSRHAFQASTFTSVNLGLLTFRVSYSI